MVLDPPNYFIGVLDVLSSLGTMRGYRPRRPSSCFPEEDRRSSFPLSARNLTLGAHSNQTAFLYEGGSGYTGALWNGSAIFPTMTQHSTPVKLRKSSVVETC